MTVAPKLTIDDTQYLFADESALENERLKRLNELYNQNTISVLTPCIKQAVSVLEIGPGTGDIGSWIAEQIGQKHYTALDISAENIATLREKIPEATCITGSVTELGTVEELRDKKFDVIFIRWVLAYIPKELVQRTIETLFEKFLNTNGSLVCEECNVYKVHCIQNDDSRRQLDVAGYKDWLQLSRNVQSFEGMNADFELGHNLKPHFVTLKANLSTYKFQPTMDTTYTKNIPVLAMKAAKPFLVGKNIITASEFERITTSLEQVAQDPTIAVNYLKNTAIVAMKQK